MPAEVASPCIGLCKMDSAGVLCLGCQRTLPEIAQWGFAPPQRKRDILKAIAARNAAQARQTPQT